MRDMGLHGMVTIFDWFSELKLPVVRVALHVYNWARGLLPEQQYRWGLHIVYNLHLFSFTLTPALLNVTYSCLYFIMIILYFQMFA